MVKQRRRNQLLTCIPTILDYKSLLYIGAKKSRIRMIDLFITANYIIDIIEIWPLNIEGLKDFEGIRTIIKGDVRNVSEMNLASYDVVMWFHGPEHVQEKELYKILDDLKKISKKLIVTACPWGIYKQGKARGNIHEQHLSYLYPEFFKELGWEINTVGREDVKGSNLLAWQKQGD